MTVTTLSKGLGRVIRLTLLVSLVVVLQKSSSTGTVFSETSSGTAQWEISSPGNYHIGEVIKAILRITTLPGMVVDTSELPGMGDVLSLPPKISSLAGHQSYDYPMEVPEGELEVVSRRITAYTENGLIITEIAYEFQYLLPIDLSAPYDDKRLPWNVPILQSYRRYFVSIGKIEWFTTKLYPKVIDFYIVPRVDENSLPIFVLFELTPPATYWPYVRLVGFGALSLALGLLVWRGIGLYKTGRYYRERVAVEDLPEVSELYQTWCKDSNQEVFIEALKLYRRGVWGQPRSSFEASKLWVITTFVLYSGVELDHDQIKSIFARLVEVLNDPV